MRETWDYYAQRNAEFFIATEAKPLSEEFRWNPDEFFRKGEVEIATKLAEYFGDAGKLADLTILEIGCGVGRQTRALAKRFKQVLALDISPEMVRRAKQNLRSCSNVSVILGNGLDLGGVADRSVDVVFSFVVFQHVTDKEITHNYVREAARVLRPGGNFLFQVRDLDVANRSADVWSGSDVGYADLVSWAEECGFEMVRLSGERTHYLWAFFLKK